ncbi:protein spinster isoform X3 [Maniola hyperantus]|uniref:protein spinster isoform X3 n=1 Tax=Aphantopus hyperantus TaxID=2795564 RepID=UPI003748F5C7
MDQSSITPNTSNQQLVINGDNDSATALLHEKQSRRRDTLSDVTFKEYMTVGILCFVNLINYMDRFTLAGVLDDVKTEFGIGDDKAGLLQTVFVIAYMVFAPIFGYLGDRYSRRLIMAFGVALWCLTTFAGSFIQSFVPFTIFRGLVGIGEASYSTIAPTIISDLFVGNVRSKMLAFFYFAIPVGSGFGYIVGSVVGAAANNWRWGLRVTPFLGLAAVALILWVMENPERGQAEESRMKPTSYQEDLRSLVRNPSFMLSTLAFTCVAFVTGALAWWGPQFIYLGLTLQARGVTQESVSYKFGLVGMAAGALGVPLGSALAQRLRRRCPDCDPIICGLALLASAPLVFLALATVNHTGSLAYLLVFLGMLTCNLTWSIVADIVLGVVHLRRADDGVGRGGRAAGRVAGRRAGEAMGARARRHLRRGPAAVHPRHGTRDAAHRREPLRAVRSHVLWRGRAQSQLGYSCRYVAGKNNGGCPRCFLDFSLQMFY